MAQMVMDKPSGESSTVYFHFHLDTQTLHLTPTVTSKQWRKQLTQAPRTYFMFQC